MYYTYVLQSLKDRSLYVGYTKDLENRFRKHNRGENLSTKPHIPYKLIYYEAFISRKDAKAREIYLKSGWDRRTINKLLKYYFDT